MSFEGCTLVENPEILPKLSRVLDLLLEKTNSKTFHDVYVFKKSAFHKKTLGKRSVRFMNESLLNHRFDEATKLLWIICQDRSSFNYVLYKGIMVVLENFVSSNENEIKTFSNDVKSLRHVNILEVQLDYLIYALKNNIYDREDPSQETKTFRKRRTRIIPYIEQLYSAYCGLMNYITWLNISRGEPSEKDEEQIAISVIACFKELIQHPGIWDIFILKLVEVLEYYGKFEEIEEVLKKYVECNPNHVNGYIYLCVHLHKQNSDPDLFIHYAKVIVDMCPSDERVLLLVQKWQDFGKYLKKRIKILFMFLDYPVNGNKILGWQLLSSHLMQALSSKKSSTMKAVQSYWNLRCHSWNYMHFLLKNILPENFELISHKVKVLSVLNPGHEYITNVEAKLQSASKKEFPDDEFIPPTSESFTSSYYFEDDIGDYL